MTVVAWTPDDVEETNMRGILRLVQSDQAHVHVVAGDSRNDPPKGSCVLLIDRPVPWLDGFTAPAGEQWREYVGALICAALAAAARHGFAAVETDVYEFGEATRVPLREHGFAPRPGPPHYGRNRIWRAPTKA